MYCDGHGQVYGGRCTLILIRRELCLTTTPGISIGVMDNYQSQFNSIQFIRSNHEMVHEVNLYKYTVQKSEVHFIN